MNRIIKTAAIAAIAGIGVIGTAGSTQAFTPDPLVQVPVGSYVGGVEHLDMNVQLDGTGFYHEYDLVYTAGADGVVIFEGVGHNSGNFDERITGSINTVNHTVTWYARYLHEDGTEYVGTGFGLTDARYTVGATGDLDFGPLVSEGEAWNAGWSMTGGFRHLPAPSAPAPGNHGEYVSGAVKAGFKGKALAAIAKDVTLVGPYTGPAAA